MLTIAKGTVNVVPASALREQDVEEGKWWLDCRDLELDNLDGEVPEFIVLTFENNGANPSLWRAVAKDYLAPSVTYRDLNPESPSETIEVLPPQGTHSSKSGSFPGARTAQVEVSSPVGGPPVEGESAPFVTVVDMERTGPRTARVVLAVEWSS